MKNILYLTDFSEVSIYARTLADKIGHSTQAKLHVMKVVEVPYEVEISKEGELIGGMADDLSTIQQEREESEQQIAEWVSTLKSDVQTSVVYGRLLPSVHSYIEENEIDLVIMATHGASGLKEMLSGSVTEHIIKRNDVPVLSLKCNRDNMDFSDFLLTGEFEDEKIYNLEILKALQQVFDSTMHLLWVNTKSHFATTAEVMSKMRSFASTNALQNVQYHVYNDKSIEEGIINFSNNYDATHDLSIDIVAVEKEKKTPLGYILTGCQATDFVNHIFRPIITYSKS